MPTATELRVKRKNVLVNARAILNKAAEEKRDVTAEEDQQYTTLWDESCKLQADAEKMEAGEDRLKKLNDALADADRSQGRIVPAAVIQHNYGNDGASLTAPYSFSFKRPGLPQHTLTLQPSGGQHRAWLRHQPDYRAQLNAWFQDGHNRGPALQAALQTDLSTAGGYMVLPEQFVAELLMNVDDMRWIRKLARTFTTTAQSLGAVKRTAKMAAFGWGTELSDISNFLDSTLAFGKRTLTPHYMCGGIKVSADLLRSSLLNADEIVRYEMARDKGELEENAFMTGNGAQKPLGLFTASNDGISTGRDISSGNTNTAIGADNLRNMKYGLKAQYVADPSLRWLFHRDALKMISKLKDGMGQYLWRDGITESDPDRILGIPVVMSEFAPSTFTSGQYVGLLGAFRFYWIVDSLEMDIKVLMELFAMTNQIAYIARAKCDAMPQIEEAFVRCTLT